MRFICLDRRIEGQWSVMLPIVQRVLNTTPHIALGVEPAKIVFGGRTPLAAEAHPQQGR